MNTTLITCLTPPGTGAIAALAVQGPRAWSITHTLFRPTLPEQPIPGQFYLGRLGAEANASDEVVLTVKPERLELHCHGGVEVVRFIQDLFTARGAVPCSWQELPGNLSQLSLLAQEQLLHAPTLKTAAILLDQFHGALEKTLLEILDHCRKNDHAPASHLLSRLAQTQHLGRHLVEPFRVVIAGPPNVGKSSLVNALAGFTRSVVSPIPGTTRDVVTTAIALDGWPVELIDTAGFHDSADTLEKEGMARARAVLDKADLRLWVMDLSASPLLPPSWISVNGVIINKVDLPAAWKEGAFDLPSRMSVSCKTGQGVTDLCQWIGSLLGLDKNLEPGEGMAFTRELGDQIIAAHDGAQGGDWAKIPDLLGGLLFGVPGFFVT